MSLESISWLNCMTLVGFTTKRNRMAWHYDEDEQGAESNHYEGAIPVADVERRLFNFEVVEAPVWYQVPCDLLDPNMTRIDGAPYKFVQSQAGRKGMLADDNLYDLGAFKDGYKGHAYRTWLLEYITDLIDDSEFGLGIGSAGLLRQRGQAWVSLELPENYKAAGDIEFRSQLTGWTSFDGSLSTGYGRHFNIIVCDNTRNIAHGQAKESGQLVKVRHTRNSTLKLNDAREALQIVHSMNDEFAQEIENLLDWKVTDQEFERVLDIIVPAVEDAQSKGQKRSATMRDKKRDEIITLYRQDDRAAPWKGTAYAVVQAFNTWDHWMANTRGDKPQVVRNQENAIMGRTAQQDNKVLTVLSDVTDRGLVLV